MTETTEINKIDDEIEFVCPRVWCDNCRREVEFFVHKTRLKGMYHGVSYRYKGKKAHCKECHKKVILPEIMLYNFQKLVAYAKRQEQKGEENERNQS